MATIVQVLAGFLLVTGRASTVHLKNLAYSVLLRSRLAWADECELWLGGLEHVSSLCLSVFSSV